LSGSGGTVETNADGNAFGVVVLSHLVAAFGV
jgi:hypothetical protein